MPTSAEREHQRDDVRVDQKVERALPERHLDALDLSAGRVQDEPFRDGRALPSICSSRRGKLGAMTSTMPFCERLARAEVRGVAHHRLGRGGVPAVLARELADVGGCVVDDLPAQVAAEVPAGRRDRRRRADVRLRRHREHVRGLADHGAGGVRARPGRRDVDDDRNLQPRASSSRSRASRSRGRPACPSRSRRLRSPSRSAPAASRPGGTPA